MALIDSYGEGNYSTSFDLYSGGIRAMAQSFLNSSEHTLTSCKFYLRRIGSPTGNIYAKHSSHTGTFGSGGTPTGSPLAVSSPIDVSTIGTFANALYEFTFSSPLTLAPGTHYCISVHYNGGDFSNSILVAIDYTSPTHSGNRAYTSDELIWSPSIYDVIFYVYGNPPDKTALTAAINAEYSDGASRTTLALTEANYTAGSWTAYTDAIAAAIAVEADAGATQTEIDNAMALIGTTKAALVSFIFRDSFTTVDDFTLHLHTPDVGTGYTQIINVDADMTVGGGQVGPGNGGLSDGCLYTCNGTYPSANYEISVKMVQGDTSDDTSTLAVRIQDANNMYALRFNEDGGRLYKRVSGTWTALGTASGAIANGSTVSLRIQGTTLSWRKNGVVQDSVTVTDHAAAGKAGIGMGAVMESGDDMSSQFLDDLLVESVAATETKTYTMDAFLLAVQVKTHTLDSFASNEKTVEHTVDSLLRASNTLSQTLDAYTVRSFTLAQSVDAFLFRRAVLTHSIDALLEGVEYPEQSPDFPRPIQPQFYAVDIYDRTFTTKRTRLRTYTSLSWEEYLNNIETAQVTLPVSRQELSATTIAPYNRVRILRGSTVVWEGYIVRYEVSAEGVCTIDMRNLLGFLRKRIHTATYGSQSVGTTAQAILTSVNSADDTGVSYGSSTASGNAAFDFANQTVFDALDEVRAAVDGDMDIDLSRQFNLYSAKGTDRSSTVKLRWHEDRLTEINAAEAAVIVDGDAMANAITGTGKGSAGTVTRTDTDSKTAYGLLQAVESYDADDAATLTNLIDADLDIRSALSAIPRMTPVSSRVAPDAFAVGDTITVRVKRGFVDLDASYRVLRKRYTVASDAQNVRQQVELAERPTRIRSFLTEIADMQRRLYNVEQT